MAIPGWCEIARGICSSRTLASPAETKTPTIRSGHEIRAAMRGVVEGLLCHELWAVWRAALQFGTRGRTCRLARQVRMRGACQCRAITFSKCNSKRCASEALGFLPKRAPFSSSGSVHAGTCARHTCLPMCMYGCTISLVLTTLEGSLSGVPSGTNRELLQLGFLSRFEPPLAAVQGFE